VTGVIRPVANALSRIRVMSSAVAVEAKKVEKGMMKSPPKSNSNPVAVADPPKRKL
jgi:hypothetical protein